MLFQFKDFFVHFIFEKNFMKEVVKLIESVGKVHGQHHVKPKGADQNGSSSKLRNRFLFMIVVGFPKIFVFIVDSNFIIVNEPLNRTDDFILLQYGSRFDQFFKGKMAGT